MVVKTGILEKVSRVIAQHLGKPGNLATLERCLDKWLGYENWLQIEVLNALTDAGLHPDYLEMWIDAPCGLSRPCKRRVEAPVKWCDWVLHAPKEGEYLWVELKTVPSARVSSVEEDMACLDLFSLQETVRLWEHYTGKQARYLTKKASSLPRSTHRGVCILSGTTDLETRVPRDRPMWSPPRRHGIGGHFALWVWERLLEKEPKGSNKSSHSVAGSMGQEGGRSMMEEILTRDLILKKAMSQGLQEEVNRILALAQSLGLRAIEKTTSSVPFKLASTLGDKTIFRLGIDYEGSHQIVVAFPFYTWDTAENQVLEGLRLELLSDLADSRLDRGGALYDLRLGLTKDNIDRLVVAIGAIFREVMRGTDDT